MLDNEFLRSLGISEELLSQNYRIPKNKSFGGSPEEESFARPFSKYFEVEPDELNRAVWDEDRGRINTFEHGEGLILLICPEEAPDDLLIFLSLPDFEKMIDDLPQPVEKIIGCRDQNGVCYYYYVQLNFADLECLAKLNLRPKH
jgi:hypothetical protein